MPTRSTPLAPLGSLKAGSGQGLRQCGSFGATAECEFDSKFACLFLPPRPQSDSKEETPAETPDSEQQALY